MHDLGPITNTVAALVTGVRDDQLTAPTPCADYTLGDLLHHLDGLTVAFAMAARKQASPDGPPPSADAAALPSDWRARIPVQLSDLAAAWRDEAAWSGPTAAGGVELDGAEAGAVAVDELVLHGWDLARASGQEFHPDEASVAVARGFVDQFSGPGTEEMRGGLFGPEVRPPADATSLEVLVALSGRDPR